MLKRILIFSLACASSLTAFPSPGIASPSAVPTQQPVSTLVEMRERGVALYNQKRFREANDVLKKAVKQNKSDHEAWYFLGLAQLYLKDFKKATKSFEEALALQPNLAAAHVALGFVLLVRNKTAEAVRAAERALSIDPKIADAHYIIGIANLRDNRRNEALKHAEAAIALNPKFAAAYLLKSQALVSFLGDAIVRDEKEDSEARIARYREAKEALEEFLRLDPNSPDRETWVEQLAGLKFYALSRQERDDSLRPRSGAEVTTKARVLRKPEPQYNEEARRNLVTGTVVLRAVFGADGVVKHIIVLRALPHGLTEAAVRAAKKIAFTPAMIDGRPVSMFMQLEYNFNLY